MKRNVFILCLMLLYVNAYSDFYYYKGQKIALNRASEQYVVVNSPQQSEKSTASGTWRVCQSKRYSTNLQCSIVSSKERKTISSSNILYSAPSYTTSDGHSIFVSHLFYVKLKQSGDYSKLVSFAQRNNVTIEKPLELFPNWYELSCIGSGKNAVEMANLFYESGLFIYAEPDFWEKDILCGSCSYNDGYWGRHWHLNNTGQELLNKHGYASGGTYRGMAGYDINYCNVPSLVPSNSDVVIAVVDDGIQLDHPDLQGQIVDSYDAMTNTSPSKLYDQLGTCCAGIIGAIPNNHVGVVGIASNCKLMSISAAVTKTSFGTVFNSSSDLRKGIMYAAKHGDSVISNSWGAHTRSNIEDEAIEYALTQGRNGLGCVVVFSSGNNDDTFVNSPGSSNRDIIVVGAMSPCGERKGKTSCDGEITGGSNYGVDLDVMAPGVSIPTTICERQSDGSWSASYKQNFNCTSAACPQVAAIAGLILSVHPGLTQKQVSDIIESTARKVRMDLYTYKTTSGRPNGTWNKEMGYGLVDAEAAVRKAKEIKCPTYHIRNTNFSAVKYCADACNLEISNVVLFNRSHVSVNVAETAVINGPFEVEKGSTFEVQ